MARKSRQDIRSWYEERPPVICSHCGRFIPEGQRDEHHLVPKSRGGRETKTLHRICHRQLHAFFTEAELEKNYPTIDALLENEGVGKFVDWVKKKPPGFFDGTKRSCRISQ